MRRIDSSRRIDTAASNAAATFHYGQTAICNTVRWLAFWAAVLLPVVYLALLAVDPTSQTLVFALLGSQLIALLVGHGHNPHP